MEHSVLDVASLQYILMAAKLKDVVARVRGLEKNEIKKVLDTGVFGIIVPGSKQSKRSGKPCLTQEFLQME